MTSFEDPVTTVVRLLDKNMHLVQDDGSLASVYCSKEWYDQQLLKNYDGQVTVGLQRAEDQKLTLNAINRRRLSFLKVNAWSSNRDVREKLREEINRIIREKRTVPNVTGYDFVGVGPPTGTHKAWYAKSISCMLPPTAPEWNELTAEDYVKIWYSDDNRYSYSQDVGGAYSLMLFRFKVESKKQTVKKTVLKFEGYGTTPSGNGVIIRAWNYSTNNWGESASGTAGEDEIITITLPSSVASRYVDENGYVWLLALTTYDAGGAGAATIYCDYASCTVTVNGITYCDVVGFRDLDQVRVKPFLWRTEFIVKTWMFEKVLGG